VIFRRKKAKTPRHPASTFRLTGDGALSFVPSIQVSKLPLVGFSVPFIHAFQVRKATFQFSIPVNLTSFCLHPLNAGTNAG